MIVEDLADIIGDTADQYIVEAKATKKYTTQHLVKKWLAVAACFCLAVSVVWTFENRYTDEEMEDPDIGTEEAYQVVPFDANEMTKPIDLFAYSVVPPEEICEAVSQCHPNVDCASTLYGFSYSGDMNENYWFPIVEDGEIIDIVFATYGSKGNVLTGHSESHANELNSIAKYTSKEDPVYVVTAEYSNYYVIGDKAYVASSAGIENEFIAEFAMPEKDTVIIEIKG